MLTEIDIESLPSFNIGFERGEKKVRKKARKEGGKKVRHRLCVVCRAGLVSRRSPSCSTFRWKT